ncbi:MAG: hypothetical protein K9N46_13340 [Candidatus Marinimicrobia bacterium]|nr:hypothetical protein [Candidatus Neomarinimicrobiota bacterium]MCF7829766.1 hypothetical protein [Candidatus Neomarinimicrobiota bacterium]MCF7881716.1 hypothetical protein [Candidatus Neomarinimicrobiota bacterium]
MVKRQYTRVLLTIAGILAATSVQAHIEGNLFLEHPPKTNAGVLIQSGSYEINDNASAFIISPFAEYMIRPWLSVGAGIPFGSYQDESGLSDAVLAIKSRTSAAGLTLVPTLTAELPTGSDQFTTGHPELVPAFFAEKKIPDTHLYGLFRGRFALGESDHAEAINPLAPHTEYELNGTLGISYFLTEVMGLDARYHGNFEELETFHSGAEIGVVYQVTTMQGTTLKGSIGYLVNFSGIREGNSLGVSFYIAP